MVISDPLNPKGKEKFYPEEVSGLFLKDLVNKTKNITCYKIFTKWF